ncbi:MAG: FKBP-type peptidyl-prolyl cis-trans isomerase [Polyangiaceae bacterium]|nr:FKBP-type peptidyl-prolyl cis-trans isomerase [Polyangiaceae bacterium]
MRSALLQHDADAFQVGPDTMVTIAYTVRDEDGEPVEGAPPEPVSAVFGHGQLLPVVEQAAMGLVAGDRVIIELGPNEAWGNWDPAGVIEVDREEIPADARPGEVFEAEHDDGPVLLLKVLDVRETTVVLDANHPLAGQRVSIELEVCGVRPATETELERARTAAVAAAPAPFDVSIRRLVERGSQP